MAWTRCLLFSAMLLLASAPGAGQHAPYASRPSSSAQHVPVSVFYDLLRDEGTAHEAVRRIGTQWHNAYAAMLLEIIPFVAYSSIEDKLGDLLARAAGQPYRGGLNLFYEWLWSIEAGEHPDYAEFKAGLYERIDPRFREYFANRPKTDIRLDEIRWGGVRRDGIPPLKNPKMIAARDAKYLDDDNVVFGVSIEGDVRAYPKRILAWHEMVKDRIGGRELNGVYCTLCGAMILYDVTVNGVRHELGTSGFLYRSNKLMYDHATKSLWSTLTGTPVVGPLVGKGIELKMLHAVTTTWREWRTRHPETLVLSLDTGHERNYGEGVAYHEYFSTDQLMFAVPKVDRRLANKADVLALRYGNEPLAISTEFLTKNRLYHDRLGSLDFVVLTDASGANRVYEAPRVKLTNWDGTVIAHDAAGGRWRVEEDQLIGSNGEILKRLPAHRSFWFGWYAQFPQTRLIK